MIRENRTAVVRLEGTLAEVIEGPPVLSVGTPIEGAAEKLTALAREYRVVIVSPLLNTDLGHRLVFAWLLDHGFSAGYDELWVGYGLPDGDLYIDNRARALP
jgi:hypothetical protein